MKSYRVEKNLLGPGMQRWRPGSTIELDSDEAKRLLGLGVVSIITRPGKSKGSKQEPEEPTKPATNPTPADPNRGLPPGINPNLAPDAGDESDEDQDSDDGDKGDDAEDSGDLPPGINPDLAED